MSGKLDGRRSAQIDERWNSTAFFRLIELAQSKISTVEGLENVPNLECLNLKNTQHLTVLEFLRPQEKLHTLNLNVSAVRYIKGLENLFSLENLNIDNSHIESLEFHSSLTKLKKLCIKDAGTYNIKNITGLGTLPHLEYLELLSLSLETLKFEDHAQKLKILILNNLVFEEGLDCEDIRGFCKFPNLEELYIIDMGLSSVDFTIPLEKLRIIDLTKSRVSSLTGLEKLPHLVELNLIRARNIKTLKFEKDNKELKLNLKLSGVKNRDQIEGFDEHLDAKNITF